MHKNNFADRFVEELRTNLLTKEKIENLGVHVIVMFTFVSTLNFYITSPSIAYTFQYAITLFFDSLGINYSFNGSCPNNKNVKDINVEIYKKIYDQETLNNNLLYIIGAYFVWFIFLCCIIAFVIYNRVLIKWIIITNVSLMAFLAPVEYYFVRELGRYSFYDTKKLTNQFYDSLIRELKSSPLYYSTS